MRAITVALSCLAALPAAAADMTFFLDNKTGTSIAVELSSKMTGTRWPGGDKVYGLDKGEYKAVGIKCQEGERICYGAWIAGNDGVTWGVGPDFDQPCGDCCTVCAEKGRETVTIARD